jgi:hypothetical protein
VLVAIETDPEFRELTSKLSHVFPDADWWTSNDMSQNEKKGTLFTLQHVGILGFLDVFTAFDGKASEQRTFPFRKLFVWRIAARVSTLRG